MHRGERLPDSSSVAARWDAKKFMWNGRLVVHGRQFSGSARTLFHLFQKLDKDYRKYLRENNPPAAEKVVDGTAQPGVTSGHG